MDTPWWVGCALSLLGLTLLAATSIFDFPILPSRFRSRAFWLAWVLMFAGLFLAVIFT